MSECGQKQHAAPTYGADVKYVDLKGRVVFVSPGIGGDTFGAFRKKGPWSIQRVCSRYLPMVSCREEAERNLNLYARNKGWCRFATAQETRDLLLRACPAKRTPTLETISTWSDLDRAEAANWAAVWESVRRQKAGDGGKFIVVPPIPTRLVLAVRDLIMEGAK